jgi:hypothetical protein
MGGATHRASTSCDARAHVISFRAVRWNADDSRTIHGRFTDGAWAVHHIAPRALLPRARARCATRPPARERAHLRPDAHAGHDDASAGVLGGHASSLRGSLVVPHERVNPAAVLDCDARAALLGGLGAPLQLRSRAAATDEWSRTTASVLSELGSLLDFADGRRRGLLVFEGWRRSESCSAVLGSSSWKSRTCTACRALASRSGPAALGRLPSRLEIAPAEPWPTAAPRRPRRRPPSWRQRRALGIIAGRPDSPNSARPHLPEACPTTRRAATPPEAGGPSRPGARRVRPVPLGVCAVPREEGNQEGGEGMRRRAGVG